MIYPITVDNFDALFNCMPVDRASGFPKYRFPSQIDFNRCREEIAFALNDFGNRWCKRESVECNAMKEWKLSIFNIVDKRIKFYSQQRPKAIHFSWLGPELLSVAWSTGAQLIIFFCFRFSMVLFDRPGISIRHAAHCVCRVLVSASS